MNCAPQASRSGVPKERSDFAGHSKATTTLGLTWCRSACSSMNDFCDLVNAWGFLLNAFMLKAFWVAKEQALKSVIHRMGRHGFYLQRHLVNPKGSQLLLGHLQHGIAVVRGLL